MNGFPALVSRDDVPPSGIVCMVTCITSAMLPSSVCFLLLQFCVSETSCDLHICVVQLERLAAERARKRAREEDAASARIQGAHTTHGHTVLVVKLGQRLSLTSFAAVPGRFCYHLLTRQATVAQCSLCIPP